MDLESLFGFNPIHALSVCLFFIFIGVMAVLAIVRSLK